MSLKVPCFVSGKLSCSEGLSGGATAQVENEKMSSGRYVHGLKAELPVYNTASFDDQIINCQAVLWFQASTKPARTFSLGQVAIASTVLGRSTFDKS